MMFKIIRLILFASITFLNADFANGTLPNVILIMADDLGIGDITPTNPNSKIKQADYYPNGVATLLDINHAKIAAKQLVNIVMQRQAVIRALVKRLALDEENVKIQHYIKITCLKIILKININNK